jgi:hypothetical protein
MINRSKKAREGWVSEALPLYGGAMRKQSKPVMPAQIYLVPRKQDDGSIWMEADTDIAAFEDGEDVGIYSLKEVRRKSIKHSLEKG